MLYGTSHPSTPPHISILAPAYDLSQPSDNVSLYHIVTQASLSFAYQDNTLPLPHHPQPCARKLYTLSETQQGCFLKVGEIEGLM